MLKAAARHKAPDLADELRSFRATAVPWRNVSSLKRSNGDVFKRFRFMT